MKSIADVLAGMRWPDRLRDLARRVEANVPKRHNPEAFHAEKSEIAAELRRLARSAE